MSKQLSGGRGDVATWAFENFSPLASITGVAVTCGPTSLQSVTLRRQLSAIDYTLTVCIGHGVSIAMRYKVKLQVSIFCRISMNSDAIDACVGVVPPIASYPEEDGIGSELHVVQLWREAECLRWL